ncbi:hypothetical protein J6590_071574 [Homalodisca vitripennis]|nr:hypothetical protein J6590_071574 [Homalodisca vitripennis]
MIHKDYRSIIPYPDVTELGTATIYGRLVARQPLCKICAQRKSQTDIRSFFTAGRV